MKRNSKKMESVNLGEFTSNLKSKDDKYANLCKTLQIIYWVLIPIYLIEMVVQVFENKPLVDIIGSLCLLFAMLMFAMLFRYYSKDYKNVDYSQPTLIMLKKAAYRYVPFRLSALWALLGVILVYLSFYITSSMPYWVSKLLIVGVGLGIIIGMIIWWIRYKPLYDGARKLIREIEGRN